MAHCEWVLSYGGDGKWIESVLRNVKCQTWHMHKTIRHSCAAKVIQSFSISLKELFSSSYSFYFFILLRRCGTISAGYCDCDCCPSFRNLRRKVISRRCKVVFAAQMDYSSRCTHKSQVHLQLFIEKAAHTHCHRQQWTTNCGKRWHISMRIYQIYYLFTLLSAVFVFMAKILESRFVNFILMYFRLSLN